jgi:DNA-damage-inducible protein D
LQRAIIACTNSGYGVVDHFAEVSKIVEAGATSKPLVDYKLTRYAYYLIVQNAGYMGLYGGMKVDDIHQKKGLKKTDKILDFMNSTELIANLFRISQTEDKLKKDNITNSSDANETHFIVGREVRGTIERVGGTMPEDLPVPKKSISKIEQEQLKRLKNNNKLMLDE